MQLQTKCMVFLACLASALATPAKIEDGALAAANTGSVVDSSHRGSKVTETCSESSAFVETTFTNPSYPSTEDEALGSCQLMMTPLNDNICQLRLDFEEFTLSQPNSDGECEEDFLQVIAGSSNVPLICGDNTGQHLYVDIMPQFGSALINVDTSSAGSKWNIKVAQIECNSTDRAPSGCLQHFTSTIGTITSFNFNPAGVQTTATRQLADQMYGVCIKSQPGYCSVTYTQRDGSTFSMSGDPTVFSPNLPRPSIVGSGYLDGCLEDYLLIPGGVIEDTTNVLPAGTTEADRYCGLAFPGATSSVQPFNLFVVTSGDEATDGDIDNQGFELDYRMNAC